MGSRDHCETVAKGEGDASCAFNYLKSTGIVYDENMASHVCLWDKNHSECPERFTEILKRCQSLNLLSRCNRIPSRSATSDELQWKHSPEMITLLESCQTMDEEELEELCSQYDSVYICRDTYRLALLACGSSINLVKAVCTNQIKNGMAIVRPPGHHAMKSAYCGFCFFNNVAIAAEYALKNFNLSRILIVDWDVHHGQGTQQMFYDDPRVLYFSIHRFEHGTFWPNLKESNADYIGEGRGKGFNFNIPLNKIGLGNADYLAIFHQILLPVALEYQPELILISAGYDAAVGCPEGRMEVTPACYAHLVNSLSHLANGKIAVVLEGGYFLKSLAEAAALTLRSLLGDACPDIGAVGQMDESVRESISNVIYFHRSHWNCFKMYDCADPPSSSKYTPCIPFKHVEEVIHRFPTRADCAHHSKETVKDFNAKIDDLIKCTKLEKPPNVCSSIYTSPTSKNSQNIRLVFAGDVSANLIEHENMESEIPCMIKKMIDNVSRSIVIDEVSIKTDDFVKNLVDYLIECADVNRIFVVNNDRIDIQQKDGCLLNVDLSTNECESNTIRYPLTELVNDADFFSFLCKILLPVAYQFNPDIVIVSLSFDKGCNLSQTSYSYLIHWLTSLAGGRLILIANYDSSVERESSSFLYCCKILLDYCVPPPSKEYVAIPAKSVTSLSALVERMKSQWFNLDLMVKLADTNNRMNSKMRTVQSTGIVYHEDMVDHFCLWDPNYTESPERFAVILKRCEALGLLDRCSRIPARLADTEEIAWIHTPELLDTLKSSELKSEDELEELSSRYDFVYFCKATYRLSLLAAGSTVNLVDAVCSDEVKNGMAIIRPPGHHAMKSDFCGYCYLNNVAMAANYALKKLNLSRILIVDWDVHHGQGTQQMFYNDPRVLYFSIHRFEDGMHWPNLKESNADYVGADQGKGFNINVPLNRIGLGNADYLSIFHQILLPVAVEYEPELIIVSAGYDAALGCPEGEMEVTPACYAHFVHNLSQLANGRLAVVLEGGYCLKSLAEGAALTLRALLGDPCPMIQPIGRVDERTRETILNVINCHRPFWKCFEMYNTYDPNSVEFSPVLKFEYEPVVVDKYPTRNVCPISSVEDFARYDSQLNKLIRDTELFIPKLRCSIYTSSDSKIFPRIPNENVEIKSVYSKLDGMVLEILGKLYAKETNSVVVDENPLRHVCGQSYHTNDLVNNLMENLKSRKVMRVGFGSIKEGSFVKSENTLQFFFSENPAVPNAESDSFIHFHVNKKTISSGDYITAWFKILFPIAYQFCPDLTILTVDFLHFIDSENSISDELLLHFLHWSTAFGCGRIILVASYDNQLSEQQEAFVKCCQTLSGATIPSIPKGCGVKKDRELFHDKLRIVCRRLQKHWTNLDYFVNYT